MQFKRNLYTEFQFPNIVFGWLTLKWMSLPNVPWSLCRNICLQNAYSKHRTTTLMIYNVCNAIMQHHSPQRGRSTLNFCCRLPFLAIYWIPLGFISIIDLVFEPKSCWWHKQKYPVNLSYLEKVVGSLYQALLLNGVTWGSVLYMAQYDGQWQSDKRRPISLGVGGCLGRFFMIHYTLILQTLLLDTRYLLTIFVMIMHYISVSMMLNSLGCFYHYLWSIYISRLMNRMEWWTVNVFSRLLIRCLE